MNVNLIGTENKNRHFNCAKHEILEVVFIIGDIYYVHNIDKVSGFILT